MKKSLYKIGLFLGIIALFVGIAIAPGITASVETSEALSPIIEQEALDNDLVEITVQIRNTDHTVMLSPTQVIQLENLIDRTKILLDAAETMEETSQIFDNTVISIYELGMLPTDMSIEDAQRLVNGRHRFSRINRVSDGLISSNLRMLYNESNSFCLIAGNTDCTFFIGTMGKLIFYTLLNAYTKLAIFLHIYSFDLIFAELLLVLFWALNPIPIGYTIEFGSIQYMPPKPAYGWLYTIGLNGIKNWNDSFFGRVLGFTGIKIIYSSSEHFYIGTALWVKID